MLTFLLIASPGIVALIVVTFTTRRRGVPQSDDDERSRIEVLEEALRNIVENAGVVRTLGQLGDEGEEYRKAIVAGAGLMVLVKVELLLQAHDLLEAG